MYESRDANPYYQSVDLDFEQARADWEREHWMRERQAADYAAFVADMVALEEAENAKYCGDCGRELGLSGGRVEGRRICLDCCVMRARALLTGNERTGDQS